MYSGHIVSAQDLIAGMKLQASKQKVHESAEILKEIYAQRKIIRSESDSKADMDSLKAINDICCRSLVGRFVLPLPAGAGKTTLIVAWCTYIHRSGADYSVAIASLQVDACFKLRQQLLDQGIPEEDIGILYSDKGSKMAQFKATCPSTTTPSNHRFLLVTHARLEGKNHRNIRLSYKGEERSIFFYDEEFRPRSGFNFDILGLRQDMTGFVAVVSDLNFKDVTEDQLRALTQLFNSTIKVLKSHMDCKTESKHFDVPIHDWTDAQRKSTLKAVTALNKKHKLTKSTVEFVETLLNGESRMFLKGSKVYGYTEAIPDEIQQVLVLDASYRHSKLSQLDEGLNELPIGSARTYRNLTVTLIECPSGRYSTTRILMTPKERADFMARISDYLSQIPKNEAVLFFTFKDSNEINFESAIRKELSQLGFNMDERIKTKDGQDRPKYTFLTWGQQNGTNDYMYCQHQCTIGVLDLGTDNIIAQAVAQTEGRCLFDDEALGVQELSASDYAQRIYQAICRTAIRNDGSNEPCTVALFIHANALDCIDMLKKALPKATFKNADPVFTANETNTDRVLKEVLKLLENLPDEVMSISTKSMFQIVEDNHGEPITKAVKTLVMKKLKEILRQGLYLWEHEGRTLKRTSLFIYQG